MVTGLLIYIERGLGTSEAEDGDFDAEITHVESSSCSSIVSDDDHNFFDDDDDVMIGWPSGCGGG